MCKKISLGKKMDGKPLGFDVKQYPLNEDIATRYSVFSFTFCFK